MTEWSTPGITSQVSTTYENYNKIKGFEDVGYFLVSYVVSGGVVTKDETHNNTVHVTKIVVSLNDDVDARDGTMLWTRVPNTTYYLDFTKGDFTWGTVHSDGTVNVDYLQVATVTTDSIGNVATITDTRGPVGGFRLKDDYGVFGYLRPVFNPLDFGAKGDGSQDETEAFEKTFEAAKTAGGGNVMVPPGIFPVTTIMKIPSNTNLIMTPNTRILRSSHMDAMFMNDSNGSGGYGAAENITITGGIIDANREAYPSQCSPVGFGHAKNIIIQRVQFRELANWHFIEINACQDFMVRDCTFKGYGPGGSEMVQIDLAYESGFPWWGPWDNTVCENVTIENCVFEDGTDGIGSHSFTPTGTFHTNIKIINNRFKDLVGVAIKPLKYQDIIIKDNHITDCFRGINLQDGGEATYGFTIESNVMHSFKEEAQSRGIMVARHFQGSAANNLVRDCGRHAVGFDYCEQVSVTGNHISNAGYVGLWIYSSKQVTVSDNRVKDCGTAGLQPWDTMIGTNNDSLPSTDDVLVTGNNLGRTWVAEITERVLIANNTLESLLASGENNDYRAVNNNIAGVWQPNNTSPGWTALPLLNSWTNYGDPNPPARYFKDAGNRVTIQGTIVSGTTTIGTTIAGLLPVGFRPAYDLVFDVILSASGVEKMARITVHTVGSIVYRGPNETITWLQMNQISFLAEQ